MGHRNTLRRIEKLTATFHQLVTDNQNMAEKLRKRDWPLVEKVRRLESEIQGMRSTALGRELVLKSITAERDALLKELGRENNG